ncbi:FtsK/SpoIIIE domain-containing protein [Oceanitalea stevensii]|uniref:FHA domain-containing protein n=1 Tax=Oceanitalea stevensii TaxID=2763072 RepID=A0ABR8Z3R3_9MICO|nr:FtsK/SpoIIIE domain-containing protein [Oceanitalea stevensii]MBD8062895.1 FHA domain-containing protein [Oceanitalea stevensii]
MRIKLTLLRTSAEPADLAVTVDGTATVAELARALAETDPVPTLLSEQDRRELTLRIHGTPGSEDRTTRLLLPEDAAAETVRSGSVVSLAQAAARFDGAGGDLPAAARLTVIDGPDAGLEVTLPEGTSIIGRGKGCDVRLSDPTVSKEHARLAVTDIIELVDLRSANGLLMGDGLVQRAALLPEDTVTLGDTTIQVTRIAASRHAAPGAAHVDFNRSPRLAPVYEGEEHEAPKPPEPPKPTKFPIVILLIPLLMAPIFLMVGRGALGMVFMLMMPLMVIGNYIDRRVTGKREYQAAIEQFGQSVDLMRTEMEVERERERTTRLGESPAVQDVRVSALALEPLLWTRRPEHEAYLDLRLGLGTLPSRATVKMPARNDAVPEHWQMVSALKEDFREIDGLPATVQLRESGALGLAGPRHVLDDVARAAVAQLVTLHSPAELILTVATSAASAARWDWTKWLPHVGSVHSPLEGAHIGSNQAGVIQLVGKIEGLLDARRRAAGASRTLQLPTLVLLVEDDAPIERGRLVRIAEEGPAVGIHVLWCAPSQERLPAVCRTFLTVSTTADGATAGYVKHGAAVRPLACDTVSEDQVLALAKHLAAVVDAGAPVDDASDLPARVSYLGLLGPETAEGPAATLERWRENGSLTPRDGTPPQRRRHDANLRALIGQAATEPFTLDLRTQGPHALVGGTTGAGKSEFLQSWVLGMAAAHSPDRVTFLFVDYKGGSAFADCVDLPHTVGLVTDLSPHLVRRALTSLRAELHFREHLLNRKGAKDLLALERTGDPECPPSLIIIVDEFAALATEVPEFVDGVVDVAQRGRSLGLHLVLATQRPAGVIKDNLRANTNLRVALRMNDESDSKDVLGLPVAAGFDPSLPGRGAARTGPGRVTMFQTGYAGGRSTTARPKPQVEVETLAMGAGTRWERPERAEEVESAGPVDEGPTDIRRVVDSIGAAAVSAGVPAPRKPWLPTLAEVQDLSALHPRTDSALPLGIVDDPAHQRQTTTYYRPDVDGNIAFYGGSGAGKSTALRTLAIAAGITPKGGPVQVYALDFASGGLTALESLPHVGSVIDGDDAERVQRLLRRLRETVEERSARYAEARASTIDEYREIAGRPDEPRILLLIDGYGAFRSEWESIGARMPFYQLFLQLLVDGRGAGVHVAVTADRAGSIPSSVAGSLPRKVVMRQVDTNAYAMLGAPKDVLDESSPPGRAIAGGLEMQVAVLGGSPNLAEQVRAIEKLAGTLRRAGVPEAPVVRRLPEIIPADTMPRSLAGRPVVGVADDTLEPVGIEALGTFLLAGPPQSGRTNALHWLVSSIQRAHPEARFLYFGARRSGLRSLDLWDEAATGPADVAELAKAVVGDLKEPPPEGRVGTVVVIEALADFLTSPADQPLVEVIKAVKRNEHLVIGEGDTSTWGASWPLIAEIRNGRRGLALQPDQMEGDSLFRTSFPRVQRKEFPVGRGMLVDKAKVRRVQLPLLGG